MNLGEMATRGTYMRLRFQQIQIRVQDQTRHLTWQFWSDSGARTVRSTEEPKLQNDKANFDNHLQIAMDPSHLPSTVSVSVFVLSSKNKYKAGVVRIQSDEVNSITTLGHNKIHRKIQQCPDRQASIEFLLDCQTVPCDLIEDKQVHERSFDEPCFSAVSTFDLGVLLDLQQSGRKSLELTKHHASQLGKSERSSLPPLEMNQRYGGRLSTETDRPMKKGYDPSTLYSKFASSHRLQDRVDLMFESKTQNVLNGFSRSPGVYQEPHTQKLNTYSMFQKTKNSTDQISQLQSQNWLLTAQVQKLEAQSQSAAQSLDFEAKRASDLEGKLFQQIRKWEDAKTDLGELSNNILIAGRRFENKANQYKEEIHKLSSKMLAFEEENQSLLFQVNFLKDQLIDKDIGHQIARKVSIAQGSKSSKLASSLKGRLEQVEMELGVLRNEKQAQTASKQRMNRQMQARQNTLKDKERQIQQIKDQISSLKQGDRITRQESEIKSVLVNQIVRWLQQMRVEDNGVKAHRSRITESDILPCLQTISKSIRTKECELKQTSQQLDIKTQECQIINSQCEQLNIAIQSTKLDYINISNLCQETKFRLDVQLTTVEVLEQELFKYKAEVQTAKQNALAQLHLRQRVLQLQEQNRELLALANNVYKERLEYVEPISIIGNKMSLHGHKLSAFSNRSDDDIRNVINQVQSHTTDPFWEDDIMQSPIRLDKDTSLVSESVGEVYNNILF